MQELAIFSVKGQMVNILYFHTSCTVSVEITQLCCCSTEVATDIGEQMGVAVFQQNFIYRCKSLNFIQLSCVMKYPSLDYFPTI